MNSPSWDIAGPEAVEPTTGREPTSLINLHFMASAIGRRRWLVACCALFGLVAGLGIAVLSPPKPVASATVLLTRDPSLDPDRAVATDLALATTDQVAGAVSKKLNLGLTAAAFGKTITVTKVTDDVLRIAVTGPTVATAITRANDLATEFLKFRGDTLTEQSGVIVTTLRDRIAQLNAQVRILTTRINVNPNNSTTLSDLVSQRTQTTTQIDSLQNQVQSELLSATSITATSRILDPATSTPKSKIKGIAVDGVGGLFVGAMLSMLAIVIGATLSWRVRRREDLADAIGAPVRSLRTRRRLGAVDRQVLTGLVEEFAGNGRPLAWVAAETPKLSARLISTVAQELAATGRQVLLVDLSGEGLLLRSTKRRRGGACAGLISVLEPDGEVTLTRGPLRPAIATDGSAQASADRYATANVILVLATVDPALGAEHLNTWADGAVIAVAVGECTPERLHTTAQLLRAAGVSVNAGLLINSDRTDESLGTPRAGAAAEPLVRAVAQ